MNYPRVLIIAMSRINMTDTANNGLLLRNLFGDWPRERLAQIYSSGSNGDEGFFGSYYQLGPNDRRLGGLFYRLKADQMGEHIVPHAASQHSSATSAPSRASQVKSRLRRLVVDTGCYELLFSPRLSDEMLDWVKVFKPDIIFAQGYCLSFALLPVMLSSSLHLPLAYYPTDDWPSEVYRSADRVPIISSLVSRAIAASSRRLVERSSVRLAFNRYMQEEYRLRYAKEFTVLMHGDDFDRYQAVQPRKYAAPGESWIVTTGVFNENRKPLLKDLDEACEILSSRGIPVRATVFPVNFLPEISGGNSGFRHINFAACPNHDDLVAVLRGADVLFLPERFDETSHGIRLSISSKAHLFMFSEKPAVVYSDPVTGIARYAKEEGWAAVVDRRDPCLLAAAIEKLIKNEPYRRLIISGAQRTAFKNHDVAAIRTSFRQQICNAVIN